MLSETPFLLVHFTLSGLPGGLFDILLRGYIQERAKYAAKMHVGLICCISFHQKYFQLVMVAWMMP